jgi:hypothetical protein
MRCVLSNIFAQTAKFNGGLDAKPHRSTANASGRSDSMVSHLNLVSYQTCLEKNRGRGRQFDPDPDRPVAKKDDAVCHLSEVKNDRDGNKAVSNGRRSGERMMKKITEMKRVD